MTLTALKTTTLKRSPKGNKLRPIAKALTGKRGAQTIVRLYEVVPGGYVAHVSRPDGHGVHKVTLDASMAASLKKAKFAGASVRAMVAGKSVLMRLSGESRKAKDGSTIRNLVIRDGSGVETEFQTLIGPGGVAVVAIVGFVAIVAILAERYEEVEGEVKTPAGEISISAGSSDNEEDRENQENSENGGDGSSDGFMADGACDDPDIPLLC